MVGLEAGKVALHHVHEEADGGAAVVGFFEDEVGQGLVGGVLRRAQDERVWIPACAGMTVVSHVEVPAWRGNDGCFATGLGCWW